MRLFIFTLFHLFSAILGENNKYHPLPRFWTNTGFCPPGDITHDGISKALLSNEVRLNLQLIAALPNGAISTVRIHWLLELIKLIDFGKHEIPQYDFSKLDRLVWLMDRAELSLGFELMGNPSGIFTKNASLAEFLWEDLTFQIGKRYLNRLGPNKLKHWRFESWNEPDLSHYNTLNFDIENFQTYLFAIRRGLDAAVRRPLNSIHLNLHGPAGLFKKQANHPLCWHTLEECNRNIKRCPLDVLTYHHKGIDEQKTQEVASGGNLLLKDIFHKYPNLMAMPVANDEADPVSSWSTPRDFQADVRYAIAVVSIIFEHWTNKLNSNAMRNLNFISHDNAFISFHPYEFSQRTLFAHFAMNNSKPQPYHQFIQKPVYAALGMLGNLGTHAVDIENISDTIRVLKTSDENAAMFLSLVAISNGTNGNQDRFNKEIRLRTMSGRKFSYIVEFLEHQNTDPFYVWDFYDAPAYPNATVRRAMRRSQGPSLYTTGILAQPLVHVNLPLRSPWLVHIRMCSDTVNLSQRPCKLQVISLTVDEVVLVWKEKHPTAKCIVTYQVWFLAANDTLWNEVTQNWHTPFLSFHFAPEDQQVKGSYKVRSVDTFGHFSEFSKIKNYI